MYPYWDCLIEPALSLLRPTSIVEIGSEAGTTTRKLVEFCKRNGGVVHAIDPAPRFDVAAWVAAFGSTFVFHRARSFDALPSIDRYDAVLIDGDHNWYTVFHELKLIEQSSAASGRSLPLVMLHDVGWPYARRDLYYNPGGIPDAYRHPYTQNGLRPDRTEPQGGMNTGLCHALTENTPRNGVLTAVEDFMREAGQDLRVQVVPGFHGLCLIFPLELLQTNSRLATFLGSWVLPTGVRRYIELLEASRINMRLRT